MFSQTAPYLTLAVLESFHQQHQLLWPHLWPQSSSHSPPNPVYPLFCLVIIRREDFGKSEGKECEREGGSRIQYTAMVWMSPKIHVLKFHHQRDGMMRWLSHGSRVLMDETSALIKRAWGRGFLLLSHHVRALCSSLQRTQHWGPSLEAESSPHHTPHMPINSLSVDFSASGSVRK